ncbi:hypothetical protein [Sphingomonas sp. NIBR02145]|uniref:hypothetical protein n=1 Tax=Sphingomonas sp. NIBR02145 TaxID=3014784 RepID=UPI0022B58607|nr:hypothetical protein [Sphingomonas sp. NIBR02145]WHU01953.1 hypothetical protein O3305_17410 [Sphingomonas sp. NIBR02145]
MGIVSVVYNVFEGPEVALDISALWRNVSQTCDALAKKLRIPQRAVPQAREGLPAPEDLRPTAIELDIRTTHGREIEVGRRRANRRVRRILASLLGMTIDASDAELKRIKAGLASRIAEVLTGLSGRLPGLASAKVQTESALSGFKALNAVHDVPTARSALEWFATTLATALAEAVVNAHLFKGEMGFRDAFGFALGVGGAIALIGIAAGIGWAQFRRPQLGRRIGGYGLFAIALGVVGFFMLGIAHYREALADKSADAAAMAQATMASAPFAPLTDTSLMPYLILNLAGFALVCWKSISMWGFLDLKRLERAAATATARFEAAKERARAQCNAARGLALDMVDRLLKVAEDHVEQGDALTAKAQEIRDDFLGDANAIADAAIAREQEYREIVEMVHPKRGSLTRFNADPPRIAVVPLAIDPGETNAKGALVARLAKIRDAMPIMTDEIGTAADEAISRIGEMGAAAEEAARSNPRGRGDNILRFGR